MTFLSKSNDLVIGNRLTRDKSNQVIYKQKNRLITHFL